MIAAGLTLIGATTYFVATRYIRNKRSSKKSNLTGEDSCEDDMISEDEDDLNYRLSNDRKRRGLRNRGFERPPPLITFCELFEQALLLQQHSMMRRNVKIYFDSNDEYVREEQMPELL